jgi:hypothetical protein
VTPSSWTETAYDWLQRSKRKRREQEHPKSSVSAAWKFVRSPGTGISFVDAALRRPVPPGDHSSSGRALPVVDIRGDAGSGKTWTVVALAARFVCATRPSLFGATDHGGGSPRRRVPTSREPRVILLDSQRDVTTAKLAYAVRSALLLQSTSDDTDDTLRREMEGCFERIHVGTVGCVSEWVAVLESIRNRLEPLQTPASGHPPTLVLWDGFLREPADEAERTEVIRQLARLLCDCSVLFVATALPSTRRYEWDKHVTHRIRLERSACGSSTSGHGYVARVNGNHFPYSISLAGILS